MCAVVYVPTAFLNIVQLLLFHYSNAECLAVLKDDALEIRYIYMCVILYETLIIIIFCTCACVGCLLMILKSCAKRFVVSYCTLGFDTIGDY